MIYEERRTLSHPKSAEDYLEYCKTGYWPNLRAEGGQPICLLSGLIGDPANSISVRKGMEDDADVFVTAGKFVYIFMGLQQRPEGNRSFHRTSTGSGLSIPDTASLNERFLTDFETLYDKRPDYDFLQGIYAQVIADRHPDCTSVAELLAMLYQRLDSMGMDVVGLG